MRDLTSQVEMNIGARKLFRDGQPILIAVSGGLDSMVLLALLHRLATEHRWKLTVAHFNHQLRGAESDADELLVKQTAGRLGLPFIAGTQDVRAAAKKAGESLEMAARKLRHTFLGRTAARLRIPSIALAHHADDQVELFFLRLLRGAGGEGLAGMKWSNPSPVAPTVLLVRPLLDQPKAVLKTFAQENKISFSEDATNSSLDIQRNRVRTHLIPLLESDYQPALKPVILRAMEIIGRESEFVGHAAEGWETARTPFAELPAAVQRRVIQRQLLALNVLADFPLVEILRTLPGETCVIEGGLVAVRNEDGRIEVRKPATYAFSFRTKKLVLTPKKGRLSFQGVEIRWKTFIDNGTEVAFQTRNLEYFDADKIGRQICLRAWQPGDRFQPIGAGSPRKLQDLFTNLKVPRAQRHQRVVAVTSGKELFWVEGLRISEKFKLDKQTARKLEWRWRRAAETNK